MRQPDYAHSAKYVDCNGGFRYSDGVAPLNHRRNVLYFAVTLRSREGKRSSSGEIQRKGKTRCLFLNLFSAPPTKLCEIGWLCRTRLVLPVRFAAHHNNHLWATIPQKFYSTLLSYCSIKHNSNFRTKSLGPKRMEKRHSRVILECRFSFYSIRALQFPRTFA